MAAIYSSCSPLALGCFLYTDINLTTTASDGTYYDGTNCWNVASGEIISQGSCNNMILTIYAVNVGSAPVDLHYSLDSGVTWNFSNLSIAETCQFLVDFELGFGSGVLIRFGDPSIITTVYPANRADADTVCPFFDINTATCDAQGFLMTQNRTAAFTINPDALCP